MPSRIIWKFISSLSVICVAGMAATPASATTQFPLQTGADLQLVCSNPEDVKAITQNEKERLQICGAYIRGFLGHYSLVRQHLESPAFCLTSEGVSAEKIRVTFLELLGQRPQFRDLPVSVDLASSIAWAFPCKKSGKTSG